MISFFPDLNVWLALSVDRALFDVARKNGYAAIVPG
jgi:hypothetical protein